ncbi:P-loop containing nucleoside triphosphate hydrolase protein [Zopfochytrium polystomum]|nr:P-loop containing nucleoside triphosphate hydrolase protein [Zopfochytrium polystomum]
MEFHESLLRGLIDSDFKHPTLLQRRAIPAATSQRRNLIIMAQSSEGKTTMLAIAALQKIRPALKQPQAIVLVPTPEHALAFKSIVASIGKRTRVSCHACLGDLRHDVPVAAAGPHLVVGTPAPVLTLIKSGRLPTSAIATLALDDADRTALRGLADPVHEIFLRLPRHTTVLLTSSSLPADLQLLATRTAHNSIHVQSDHELTLARNKQFYVDVVRPEWKLDTLLEVFDLVHAASAITYCNDPATASHVAAHLQQKGFPSAAIILDDLSPLARASALRDCRSGVLRFPVVCENVGGPLFVDFDFGFVDFFVQYDFPHDPKTYLRRVGRRAEFGRRVAAVSFVAGEEDMRTLREVETMYGTEILEAPMNLRDLI